MWFRDLAALETHRPTRPTALRTPRDLLLRAGQVGPGKLLLMISGPRQILPSYLPVDPNPWVPLKRPLPCSLFPVPYLIPKQDHLKVKRFINKFGSLRSQR